MSFTSCYCRSGINNFNSTSRITVSSHVISERRLVGLSSLVSIIVYVFDKSPNLHGNMCIRATSYRIKPAEDEDLAFKIAKAGRLKLISIISSFQ